MKAELTFELPEIIEACERLAAERYGMKPDPSDVCTTNRIFVQFQPNAMPVQIQASDAFNVKIRGTMPTPGDKLSDNPKTGVDDISRAWALVASACDVLFDSADVADEPIDLHAACVDLANTINEVRLREQSQSDIPEFLKSVQAVRGGHATGT